MFKVKYGDDYLTDYVKFTKIERGVASENTLTTEENSSDGVEIVNVKRGPKEIPMSFHVIDGLDVNIVRRKLAQVLSSTVSKKLNFSDEPNYYYNAILTGKFEYTDNGFEADGSFTLFVSEGVAHRTDRVTLNSTNSGGSSGTITKNSDGTVRIKIINNGTKPAYPRIDITNNQENGYLSLAHVSGGFAMGKITEADGKDVEKSEYLYDSKDDAKFSEFKDVVAGTINPQNNWLATNGKLEFQTDGLRLKDKGTVGSNQGVAGGMKVMTLPADSNGHVGAVNFYSYFNLFAWAGAFGQTGLLQVLFTDVNDKLVAGYGISKGDMSGNKAQAKFWCGGSNPRELGSKDFISNNGEGNGAGDMNNTQFNERNGSTDFVKTGEKLEFYWKGARIPFYIPDLANVEIAKVYIYIGQYTQSNKFMTNLSVRNISCRKDNIQKWEDIPNRYAKHSKFSIDSYYGTISIDGVSSANEKINGAKFLVFPPGESEIILSPSSWVNIAPDVEISWEENIL
ncbi:distal tail protein Dit [Lactococcus lactis]|uniref:distal tail protein Dit n=1 Tax=Lactococcus lactis TaxID=1358 RepID=UPI0022E12811|nr:distal tail protein Dit [Lactococcus lactis]